MSVLNWVTQVNLVEIDEAPQDLHLQSGRDNLDRCVVQRLVERYLISQSERVFSQVTEHNVAEFSAETELFELAKCRHLNLVNQKAADVVDLQLNPAVPLLLIEELSNSVAFIQMDLSQQRKTR